jgi:hypothetical protein
MCGERPTINTENKLPKAIIRHKIKNLVFIFYFKDPRSVHKRPKILEPIRIITFSFSTTQA